MREPTRRSTLAALGVVIATAGCLATDGPGSGTDPPSQAPDTPSNTSPSPDGDDDPDTGTPTGGGITHGANEPRADHGVYVTNRSGSAHDVRVAVTRKSTEEVVFEETVDIASEAEREVYNLERADPEGVESFSVCGQFADSGSGEDCETIRTSQCYGDAFVTVEGDGSLQVIYAVC